MRDLLLRANRRVNREHSQALAANTASQIAVAINGAASTTRINVATAWVLVHVT